MADRTLYLRPSSAHAWRRCAGYAALNARVSAPIEDADNDVREDGTATHWLAATAWHLACWTGEWLLSEFEGTMSPNNREITEELTRGAQEYLDYLRTWPGTPADIRVEQQLPTGAVFTGCQDGTPDAYAVSLTDTLGRLADLKMGFDPVEVWRNYQLTVYGWTIMCMWLHLTHMEFTIVQPRANHRDGTIRSWIVSREELRVLAEELQAALAAALAPEPVCTVSRACRNCAARHACRSLAAAGGAGVDTSYDTTPHELTPEQLGYELLKLQQAAQHMEHRITGLTAQAESIIRTGKRVPGYGLERKATRYRFRDDKHAEIEQLGQLLGVDVHAPVKLHTPAQLRGKFRDIDIVTMYAERPTGELVLKAIDPNEAVKAFITRKETPK